MFRSPDRPRRAVRAAAIAGCAGAVLLGAACSSSGSTAASSSSAAAPSSSAAAPSASGGSSAAAAPSAGSAGSGTQALVQQHLAVPAPFADSSPPVTSVAKVKGDKILYIPISLQIGVFQATLASMQQAAGHVGITVSGCDGKFGPAGAAACVNQALAEHVSAVVLDNIPVALIGQGLHQLQAAHIAVLEDQANPVPGNDQLAYLDVGGASLITSMADWIAADSGGKADVLVIEQNDTPEQVIYVNDDLLPEFKKTCPACKTKVIALGTDQLHNLPTQVETALVQDPAINYVASEFDANVPSVVEGLKNSPLAGKVKIAGALGDVSSLERVKSGQQAYDALASVGFGGWVYVDDVLRMLTGMPPVSGINAPWRAFAASNVGSVTVSAPAVADDGIFGGNTYSKVFLKLWGVS
ncbi:MAG TPA: substrate-binding domain-containing protein [Trebonia sp.]